MYQVYTLLNRDNIIGHLMCHLYQLTWNGCEDITLPEDMGTMLRHLDLAADNLTSLPASFSGLISLRYLNLANNKFESVPDVLKGLNIPKLYLKNCS